MDGVIVVDKPEGMTSHDVVAVARRALREKRVGHTGTLDPLATGVLPLACGRATRLVRFLTASEKEYRATIRFGIATDSYDLTGEPMARTEARPTGDALDAAVASLRGDYLQRPPAFSAKKVNGVRAYALARVSQPMELTPVPVHVSSASVLSYDGQDATIDITCSAGFYVRSFAHELGRITGGAACLAALRRTRSGQFTLEGAMTVSELQGGLAASRATPLEHLLPHLPAAHVTSDGYARVSHGRELDEGHVQARTWSRGDAWVRLIAPDGRLVALAEVVIGGVALHPSVVLI